MHLSVLPLDPSHAALVVIPTVAFPQTLVPTVARISADAEHRAQKGLAPVALVLAVNTPDPGSADEAVRLCRGICDDANNRHPGCIDLEIWRTNRPIGFGAANNRGLAFALKKWSGVPELVVFHNDDAHVPAGWLERMADALQTTEVHGYSEPWVAEDVNSTRAGRPASVYGRIGLVGPVSNLVAGVQQANAVATPGGVVRWTGHVEPFAAAVAQRYAGQRVTCDFLSGFCIGLGREALSDLMLEARDGKLVPAFAYDGAFDVEIDAETTEEVLAKNAAAHVVPMLVGPWDEVSYPIAGYEDNDLCVRAELSGWRCVIAADCFVGHIGHQTFDRLFPGALRGMRNRSRFYARWAWMAADPDDKKLIVALRLRFEVGNDVHMTHLVLARAAQLVDGVAIVLTANPLEVVNDPAWASEERQLQPEDRAMLQACSGKNADECAVEVQKWAESIMVNTTHSRVLPGTVAVESWGGEFNERDERNRSHAMAEDLGADWILSLDHDELIEDRLRRDHFNRWMSHPDPLVRAWDQAWLTHWDSARLTREDHPWGDAGRYVGGMHGFRMWRVPRQQSGAIAIPRRILAGTANGLHCGNSPDHDLTAKRTSGFRFRHLGYLRVQDRKRKRQRYRVQDPDATADRALTGARGADPYGHLIHEEGMRLTPYSPINGIGLHILVHAGEKVEDLARVLDQLHGLVDRVVLVWTDAWDAADKKWLAPVEPHVQAAVDQFEARHEAWVANGGHASGAMEPPPLRTSQKAIDAVLAYDELSAPLPAWNSGPSFEIARMAARFGCAWVHQPLNDDLAAARNAGLEALGADAQGLGWSLFLDLDEHFGNPFAEAVAIRRAAEATDCHGWLWQFANHHRGAAPSRSESVRMARLVPDMRLFGRVHETFDQALVNLQNAGVDVIIRQAPFIVQHIGLDQDDDGLARKLRRYQRLLIQELEDHPYNSQAWVSLALHELNDGREESAVECLRRGVLCAGNAYLAYRELAFYHFRQGRVLLQAALERTSPAHDFRKMFEPFLKTLDQHILPLPILGSAQRGQAVCPPIELPEFVWPPPRLLQSPDTVALDADVYGGVVNEQTDEPAEEPPATE